MDVPEGAQEQMELLYGREAWTLLHAWIGEGAVLAVVAVAADGVFDQEEDAFNVDGVRLDYLQLTEEEDGAWSSSVDASAELGDVFGELVHAFEHREHSGSEPLES
ncbi:MAG: hypothetical protein U5K81_01580 [Trueperaceae bacterium]|nr:hypothetical protein [Trueperaceae bacterium]MDZ7799468.1 hypothetical protein [Trueperaceae bacterium]